jgi:hypothetical protein
MRGVWRRLFKLCSAVSLAVCLAALAGIPLSFVRVAWVVRNGRQSSDVMHVIAGCVILHDQRGPGMAAFLGGGGGAGSPPQSPWSAGLDPADDVTVEWDHALRPRYWELSPVATASGAVSRRGAAVPLWLLAAVFALPATVPAAGRLLRRRPQPAGACPACGYDLRATPDRCPECGRPSGIKA